MLANLILCRIVREISDKKADCHRYLIEPLLLMLIKHACGEVSQRQRRVDCWENRFRHMMKDHLILLFPRFQCYGVFVISTAGGKVKSARSCLINLEFDLKMSSL